MKNIQKEFINNIASGNYQEANNLVTNYSEKELEDFYFVLSDEVGLLLIHYLTSCFLTTRKRFYLDTILGILTTTLSYFEGNDYFKIFLIKKALEFYPDSIEDLDLLLYFDEPPYIKGAFSELIDFREVRNKLERLRAENKN